MIKFECNACKHLSKSRCGICGLRMKDYKVSHPKVFEDICYYALTAVKAMKFKMESTGDKTTDKQLKDLWGCQLTTSKLELMISLAKLSLLT